MDITDRRRIEEHDRLLATAAQTLASTDTVENTLTALAELLVPRFATSCAFYLRAGNGLNVAATAGPARPSNDDAVNAAVRTGLAAHARQELVLPLRAGGSTIGGLVLATADRSFEGQRAGGVGCRRQGGFDRSRNG